MFLACSKITNCFAKKQVLSTFFKPIQKPKKVKQSQEFKSVKQLFYKMNDEKSIQDQILENHNPKQILKQIDTNLTSYFQKRNPDIKSINFLIQAIIAQNQFDQLEEVLEFMNSMQINPNLETYMWLITGYGKFRDIHQAEEYYELARKKFGESLHLDTTLINAYCKNFMHKEAMQVFNDLKRANFQPDVPLYTTLINTFYRVKQWDKCWELFNEAKFESKPDENLLGLMIEICADTHDAEKAISLYNQMENMEFRDTTYVYNAIIKALGSRKDYAEKALEYYRRMVMNSVSIDSDTIVCTLKACANCGDLKIAHEVLKSMIDNGIQPNKYIYNQMVRVYIGVCSIPNLDNSLVDQYVQDAWKIFNEAATKEMITPHIINSLCELMVATHKLPDLEGLVLPLFDQYKLQKDKHTYEAIIKILFHEKRLLDVFRVFEEQVQKLEPSFTSVCCYLETAMLLADEEKVIDALEWCKKISIPFQKIDKLPKYKHLKQLGTMKNIPIRIHALLDEYEAKFGKVSDPIFRLKNNQRPRKQQD